MKRYTLKNLNKKRLAVVALVMALPLLLNQCHTQKPSPDQLKPIVSQTVKPTQKPIAPITKPVIEPVIEQKREPMLDNEEVTGLAAVGMERSDRGFINGTCADLRVRGLGQFPQGDVNYTPKRDRDRNGIACD